MPITMSLREAVLHKVHGKSKSGMRDMIEGSIDAQEAALPGLGVVFEVIWKNIDNAKQDELLSVLQGELEQTNLTPLK
ncbi:small acid-soluble spore protein I (minor) [Fontibacillus phaseoli]|uniref:Small, acid-soluble spore protein I n=1 Tax=Fontibacillus phaseoli TaxID=1416533 RepID=A0A369BG61_9BACL|nr:small acid-soluble spore protein SspI [Fontibacillus phaseoli]RCX19588.1 small acid-soluble spore protein I (minor) [Fontibacillus phaseoli]